MVDILFTKRGRDDLPKRNNFDFYPTPYGVCVAALAQLPPDLTPKRILDPGAGTGVWGRAARARWPDASITGIEIRETPMPDAYNVWTINSFQTWQAPEDKYDLILGNPPFKVAEEFIRKCMTLLTPRGVLQILLRLSFLDGQDRGARLFKDYPLSAVIVVSKRINFTDGDNNPHNYAMYQWREGHAGDSILRWMSFDENTPEPADTTVTQQLSLF